MAKYSPQNILEISVVSILVLGLVYTVYAGWVAMNSGEENAKGVAIVTPKTTASPVVPDLLLNSTHQRQGDPIQVNQGDIGKDNPFTK